jgi:hypothetical protein
MVVIWRTFVYDVADPVNPRLVCRGEQTVIHLVDANTIAYTTVAAGKVVIIRRDLTTGAESQVAQLRADPNTGTTLWTSDGSLEVYPTAVPLPNNRWLEQVHLWSNRADHVLYTFNAGPGGSAGRWSAHLVLAMSPDHAYVAMSDSNWSPQNYYVRIFSVSDLRQKAVSGTQGLAAGGGTWVGSDRFVWAAGNGVLMQWTPKGGVALLRSERWFTPASSPDGLWLAGTLITDTSKPSVMIVPTGAGQTHRTGLASWPGFVTPTVVWYAEESFISDPGGYVGAAPNGVVHAFDVVTQTDRLVHFNTGQSPKLANGAVVCCGTES